MAREIVWTPENSVMGLGTVAMPMPTAPLTLEQYRGLLARRINRMVDRAGPEEAETLLSRGPSLIEHLEMAPEHAGEVMAWNSEWLGERSGMSPFPVPVAKIRPDPDLTPEMLEETTLEEFLSRLYHDSE